jgi:hypothetical protein
MASAVVRVGNDIPRRKLTQKLCHRHGLIGGMHHHPKSAGTSEFAGFPKGGKIPNRARGSIKIKLDADGFFSYRRGSVDVLKLEGELLNTVKKAINSMDDRDINYLYEASVVNGIYDINGNYIEDIGFDFGFDFYGDGEYSITTFWVFFALLGFAVPLVILVLGLLFARSKKMGKNSFWYALSGFGAAWILAAAGIMLMLL